MAKVAYLDDNILLGESYALRDYTRVRSAVLSKTKSSVPHIDMAGEIYGYEISTNGPLTKLYGFPCYVVKFLFSGIETLHNPQQEQVLQELCELLRKDINNTKGYYTLRVPTHIVDLLKAVNCTLTNLIHCGGTVAEVHINEVLISNIKEGLNLFFADENFVKNNKELLMNMAFRSFRNYQGQYHISPVTDSLAGDIYRNWIGSFFDSFNPNTILIAAYDCDIAGYCAITENDIAVDVILNSVNEEKRQLGTYKAMITTLIHYAKQKNKLLVSSTQLDNFIVQGTWNSLGMRPFYSIYNLHYDNR